jgi:hypothetical protein
LIIIGTVVIEKEKKSSQGANNKKGRQEIYPHTNVDYLRFFGDLSPNKSINIHN